jgi:hypothetical protein
MITYLVWQCDAATPPWPGRWLPQPPRLRRAGGARRRIVMSIPPMPPGCP